MDLLRGPSTGDLRSTYIYPEAIANAPIQDEWYGCYQQLERQRFKWMAASPKGDGAHPAKMAWLLAERIVTEGARLGFWRPGDRILSPMAGEGTELLAFYRLGYEVVGIEIEPIYYERLKRNFADFDARHPLVVGHYARYFLTNGDATDEFTVRFAVNPMADAVVFSPTYEASLKAKIGAGPRARSRWEIEKQGREYVGQPLHNGYHRSESPTPGQLGDLEGDTWRASMRKIYENALTVTREGGYLCTVTKDAVRSGRRYPVALYTAEDAIAAGWREPVAWFRAVGAARTWAARFNNRRHHQAGQDDLVVNHEDVLVFVKG